jgi:hypothetical protein
MSGLRDWSNEGGTAEECALLAASRSEVAPSLMRSRTLAALGVGTAVTASTVTATTTATAAAAAGSLGLGAVAKIAGVVLLVSGVTAGGVVWHAARKTQPAPIGEPAVTVKASTPAAPPAADTGGTAAAFESAPPSALPSGQAAAVRSHAPPAASSASLSKEVAALERAHAAIAAHDPDAALRALDRYRAQFPGGALASEEAVLRVQAMVARGDKSNATDLANSFRANHPDSPYGRGVQDLVSKKASKP